jgi:hypothetical protein
MGWVVSASPLAALLPGMTWYPLYRSQGRPQGRSGRVRKISLPLAFDPRTVQPVASRYTSYAIPAKIGVYIWSIALCGAETWTLRAVD